MDFIKKHWFAILALLIVAGAAYWYFYIRVERAPQATKGGTAPPDGASNSSSGLEAITSAVLPPAPAAVDMA